MENSSYYEMLEQSGKKVVYSFLKDDLGRIPLDFTLVAGEIVEEDANGVTIKFSLGERAIMDYVIDTEGNKLSTDLISMYDEKDVHTEDNRYTVRCKRWEVMGVCYGYNVVDGDGAELTHFLWATKSEALTMLCGELEQRAMEIGCLLKEARAELNNISKISCK